MNLSQKIMLIVFIFLVGWIILGTSNNQTNTATTTISSTLSQQHLPIWSEKLGLLLAENLSYMAYNVTAVAQSDNMSYGPAYLLNGLSNLGYWYQAGLGYNSTIFQNGSHLSGFYFVYQIFNPSGSTIYPQNSGSGGYLNFSGPIHNGDRVLLKIYIKGHNITMSAYDWNTGAIATLNYSSFNATTFVPIMKNGYGGFTGVMTEWHHSFPDYSAQKEVTYTMYNSTVAREGVLFIDEHNKITGISIIEDTSSLSFDDSLFNNSVGIYGPTESYCNNNFITGQGSLQYC